MKIIFICTGNTCRSPFAAGYLESFDIKNLEVLSRGLAADSSPVSENSVVVARELGFDISNHISSPVFESDLDSDYYICMSQNHKTALLSGGIAENKIIVLSNGINDPYGMPLTVYRAVGQKIANSIDELAFSGFFTDFTVRDIKKSDIDKIVKLENRCFGKNGWSADSLCESLAAGTHFFVAERDGEILGYCGISAVIDEGYVTNVAVFDNVRRQGVGNMLMNRLVSFAREAGLNFISLEVRASNTPAISLYTKKKFKKEGVRSGFYTDPKEDAIIYTRRFNV